MGKSFNIGFGIGFVCGILVFMLSFYLIRNAYVAEKEKAQACERATVEPH